MTERSFDPAALTRAASDTLSVRRVFGEAYEHGGALVVPVGRVTGAAGTGAGGGAGDLGAGAGSPEAGGSHGTGDGGGGGWTTHVTPLGVFVVDASGARWSPVVDVNRAILGGQLLAAAVAGVWALAWAVRRRR